MPTVEAFTGQLPKLGQGYKGRLPGGGGGGGLTPPPGIPHIHMILKPPPINYGAVAQVGRQARQAPSPLMARPLPGLAAAPGFGAPLPQVPKMPKLGKAEKQAMGWIKNQGRGVPSDQTKALVVQPTTKMQIHLANNPALSEAHQDLKQLLGGIPSQEQVLPATPHAQAAIKQSDIAAQKPMAAGIPGVPLFSNPVAAWGQRALGGLAQDAVSAGPGIVAAGAGLIHHPVGETEALGKATGLSFYNMVRHPGREFVTHPDQGIMNALTVASLGLGAAAKVGTIADAASALRAGELTPLQAALKVTHPTIYERNLHVLPGDASVRVRPPAFKSALGGTMQTKLLDPLTEKLIKARAPSGANVRIFNKDIPIGPAVKLAERHGGKLLQRDVEMKTGMARGAEEQKLTAQLEREGKLPPKVSPFARGQAAHEARVASRQAQAEIQQEAFARGSLQSHANLWHSLYNNGAGAHESLEHDPTAYVGIRKPPESFGPKDVEKYSSQSNIAREWNKMVETNPEKLQADPTAYTYIPRAMWNRLKLEAPAGGTTAGQFAAKGLNYIDRGNQLIRSGRFIHPGYAAWAVQNGVLHLSQAGMHIFRNAWQHRNELSRLSPEDNAMFGNAVGAGHFGGGGVARAYGGGEGSFFPGTKRVQGSVTAAAKFKSMTTRAAGFWHKVDDKYWREMSMIHELNRQGYHSAEDWSKLMHDDPTKFRSIAHQAQNEAINYTEMSPAERETLAKVMTAWGWTRGASTYTMRFPFQHPVQANALTQLAGQGQRKVDNFYSGLGGMSPSWLRGYLPIGHGNHPSLIGTSDINPGETFGSLAQSVPIPGLQPKGPHDPLVTQLGPVAQGIEEAATGHDPYGKTLAGNAGQAALNDVLKRFTPLSYLNTLTGSKKGGGTFTQGAKAFALDELGIPLKQLVNPKQTAALGMKDWETSLSKPDEIQFRYTQGKSQLPAELKLYQKKTGTPLSPSDVGMLKGDMEAVEQRDMWQYRYAQAHGANSFRTLPAKNRAQAAIAFMTAHKYFTPALASQAEQYMSTAKSEADMNTVATALWGYHPIGKVVTEWKSKLKTIQPSPLTPARP